MDDRQLLVEQAKSDPHVFGQLFDRHYVKALSSNSWNPDKSFILQQWRHKEDKLRIMLQNKDAGKISSITYRSYHQGQLVTENELTFLREQFLPYDPGLFDENLFQLEAYDFEKITEGN